MAQQPRIKHPETIRTINMHNYIEVENWCNILNCRPRDLAEAVNKVGPSAEAVKQYLSNQRMLRG